MRIATAYLPAMFCADEPFCSRDCWLGARPARCSWRIVNRRERYQASTAVQSPVEPDCRTVAPPSCSVRAPTGGHSINLVGCITEHARVWAVVLGLEQ